MGWRAEVARREHPTEGDHHVATASTDDRGHDPGRAERGDAGRLSPRGLASGQYYRRAPDQLSEEEVRAYLLDLRQRGVARGTFQIARFGLQFFFCHTLGRTWELFGEKKDRLAAAEAAA